MVRLKRLVTDLAAVVDADDPATAFDLEIHKVVSERNDRSIFIHDPHSNERKIPSVGMNPVTIRFELQRSREPGRPDLADQGFFAGDPADRLQRSRHILQSPHQMEIVGPPLANSLGLSVEEQFDFLAVGIRPDVDRVAVLPVPVGKDVKNGVSVHSLRNR